MDRPKSPPNVARRKLRYARFLAATIAAAAVAAVLGAAPAHAQQAAPITLPSEGKKLEPPVARTAIREGAWSCDMGTVH